MGPVNTKQEDRAQPLFARTGKALLVVEDPGELHYYCNILEGYGYQVRACPLTTKVRAAWGQKFSTSLW